MALETQRLWLTFDGDSSRKPLIYEMSKQFDVVFNIRNASVTPTIGIIALELEGKKGTGIFSVSELAFFCQPKTCLSPFFPIIMLKRFWFKLSPLPPNPLNLGCGITAYDYDDAVALLKERVFSRTGKSPEIVSFVEDVDISSLDEKHVKPNMEVPVVRGVWFPKGYN